MVIGILLQQAYHEYPPVPFYQIKILKNGTHSFSLIKNSRMWVCKYFFLSLVAGYQLHCLDLDWHPSYLWCHASCSLARLFRSDSSSNSQLSDPHSGLEGNFKLIRFPLKLSLRVSFCLAQSKYEWSRCMSVCKTSINRLMPGVLATRLILW